MTAGIAPIGFYPLGFSPDDYGSIDRFASIDPDDTDLTWLAFMRPYNPDVVVTAPALPAPLGVVPLGAIDYTYMGGYESVYFSDHHNFTSKATDTPASTLFDGVLDPAYSITVRLGSSADPLGGAAVDIGNIGIADPEGDYDGLVNRVWADTLVDILVGKSNGLGDAGDWAFSEFALAFRGIAIGITGSEDKKNLAIKSRLSLLDQNVTRRYYLGTGGREGPADLAGVPVPVVWGEVSQVEARLLDADQQIHQFAAALDAISNLCNRGVPVFAGTISDYPTYASLDAATVAPGEYATCLAEGLVRTGSPCTLLTADLTGLSSVGSLAGGIAQEILGHWLGPGRNLGATAIYAAQFAQLDVRRPWPTGVYLSDEQTVRAVLDQLMRDVGAALICSRDGLIGCAVYDLPSRGPAPLVADDIKTDGIERIDEADPVKQVAVGYAPNVRPLVEGDMPVDEITGTARTDKKRQYLTVIDARSPPGAARNIAILTNLRNQTDARSLAKLVADMLSVMTHYYKVPLVGRAFNHWVADARRLTYDRWGQQAGYDYLVAGVTEGSAGDNSLILWGPRGAAN